MTEINRILSQKNNDLLNEIKLKNNETNKIYNKSSQNKNLNESSNNNNLEVDKLTERNQVLSNENYELLTEIKMIKNNENNKIQNKTSEINIKIDKLTTNN